MNIVFSSDKKEYNTIKKGTEILLAENDGFNQNIELFVKFQDRPEILINKRKNQIHIICREISHYYRALNYAIHHMKEDEFQYREHVCFERNGLMLDCSRNAVFTVEKVKFLIKTLAKLGMNVLMLYTEDTYEVEGQPYFGAYRGKYTKDEIKELDAYASMFGVELVPCIQTLAHLHNVLKWPGMDKIRDSADILQPEKEETYQFIEKLLSSVKEDFSTNRVHLGMDEAVMLGLGNYLKENGYKKGSLIIREHCNRVVDICRKLELKPMIWSDMYITANSTGGYYDLSKIRTAPNGSMCIKSAYDRSDRAALKDISQNVIPGIICNLTDMKSSREKIWMNDAKPFGYEILDIKIGGVITRLKSTGYRIDNYLNGNVLRLEELEEERLPYFTKGMDKRENLWNRIISGCDLNDTI